MSSANAGFSHDIPGVSHELSRQLTTETIN